MKSSKWNEHRPTMPQYSVLEAVLVATPDFDDLDALTTEILRKAEMLAEEITHHIKSVEQA